MSACVSACRGGLAFAAHHTHALAAAAHGSLHDDGQAELGDEVGQLFLRGDTRGCWETGVVYGVRALWMAER